MIRYRLISKEDQLFSKYIPDEDNEDIDINIDKKKSKKNKEFLYDMSFSIKNGLMSGWKMTSLFGSLFNLSLNKICEKWTLMNGGDAVFNLNVLGDDSHIKRRFLVDSLNHVNFVNVLGKVAHPTKQMISTTSLEYLKKKINTIEKKSEYSNLTILNTFLYQKPNKKKNEVDKSSFRE